MRHGRTMGLLALGLTLLANAPAVAQTTRPVPGAAAGTAPAGQGTAKTAVGDVRITTLQGYEYLHTTSTQPLRGAFAMWAQMGQVMAGIKSSLQIAGAPVMTITDEPPAGDAVPADPNRKVKVEVGFPVNGPAGALPAGLTLDKVPPERCAVALYTGPMHGVHAAYAKLSAEVIDTGSTPTGVTRMRIFYFESEDSPNNVFMLQMGVQ